MRRYKNYSRSDNNSLLMRLLGYALTTFVIPFIINRVRNILSNQQRPLCNKCNGKLQVIDKGKFYCKNCKIIKFDNST
jgi:hypothetical protein